MQTIAKPDLYTKIVLTVIAVCLVWLCVDRTSLSTPAYARDLAGGNEVGVTNLSLREPAGEPPQVMAVKIVGLEMPGGIPVTLSRAPTTPVTIVGVDVASEWGPANTLPVTFPSNVNFPTTYERRGSR
jgi:hypothetical protein